MTCPSCGEGLPEAAQFCENCGTKVGSGPGLTVPGLPGLPVGAGVSSASGNVADEAAPISAPTAIRPRIPAAAPAPRLCQECGGSIGAEGYCDQCGSKAASERDHFREAPTAWVAGVCDRGLVHSRNEDAMALWAQGESAADGRAVLVVCDGVSSSQDSDVAALAGARAAREVLCAPLPNGLGVAESREAAATKVLVAAAAAANTAVVAHTDLASANPASCTFVAATMEPAGPATGPATGSGAVPGSGNETGADGGTGADGIRLRHACVGDSRAYWFPDGGPGVQLTVDDSMAQMLIAGGAPRTEAEAAPQAHAITKWLGKDSPDIVPVVGSLVVTEPGWLLVCSDGLWNYASEPDALVARMTAAVASGSTTPGDLALALVEFAKGEGGRDNITVALARVGVGLV